MIKLYLSDLLPKYTKSLPKIEVSSITLNSKKVVEGALFIARQGSCQDGTKFIAEAIQRGARSVFKDGTRFEINYIGTIPVIDLPNLQEHIGTIAASFYGDPSKYLKVIGVTGTNGKSTTVHLLREALNKLEIPTASIGTLGVNFQNIDEDFGLTTPDAITLQEIFANLLKAGAKVVVMEVSSHALDQGRVEGTHFMGAIFTNLTQDHLDYHGDMNAYFNAKARLFTKSDLQFVILNSDDEATSKLTKILDPKLKAFYYGFNGDQSNYDLNSSYLSARIENATEPLAFTVTYGSEQVFFKTKLFGDFNVLNILCVVGTLLNMNFSMQTIASLFPEIEAAPGRMQWFQSKDSPQIIVDYAHTPDALEKALKTARAYSQKNLWCIFGCGGDRDRSKRAKMGKIAFELADKIIITNDNPRTEDPKNIAQDILADILPEHRYKVQIELDRKLAIGHAFSKANSADVIVVAGKGHEATQTIGTTKYPFSDAKCIQTLLNEVDDVTVTNR